MNKNKIIREIDGAQATPTIAVEQQTLRKTNKAGNAAMIALFRMFLRA